MVVIILNDRGNKKWQGFFIPEHIKMLKDTNNDYHKQARPILDESQIEEMEQLLSKSLNEKRIVEIFIWKNGYVNSRIGCVKKLDSINKKIQIQDELDLLIWLDFYSIIDVIENI